MVLLTFNVLKAELLDGSKTRTIRANATLWEKRWTRRFGDGYPQYIKVPHDPPPNLDIWWKNPRTMHINKDCYKMGIAHWAKLDINLGKWLTAEDARLDGFTDLSSLLHALSERNKMVMDEVMKHRWAILTWDWKDGPHQPPEVGV